MRIFITLLFFASLALTIHSCVRHTVRESVLVGVNNQSVHVNYDNTSIIIGFDPIRIDGMIASLIFLFEKDTTLTEIRVSLNNHEIIFDDKVFLASPYREQVNFTFSRETIYKDAENELKVRLAREGIYFYDKVFILKHKKRLRLISDYGRELQVFLYGFISVVLGIIALIINWKYIIPKSKGV